MSIENLETFHNDVTVDVTFYVLAILRDFQYFIGWAWYIVILQLIISLS